MWNEMFYQMIYIEWHNHKKECFVRATKIGAIIRMSKVASCQMIQIIL